MKTNVVLKSPPVYTHEGAKAVRISVEQELRRLTAACMLWESNFYESGKSVVDRIMELVPQCRPEFVAACAFDARTKQKLRHVPLLLVREMCKTDPHKKLVSKLLPDIIERVDEITEFLALFTQGRESYKKLNSLPAQAKRGLAAAFHKFNEYQFAKYDRAGIVSLKDAMFLVHPKPKGEQQEELFKKIANGQLRTPNTWEVLLSSGQDKKETFISLIKQNQLGDLAFLRNLKGMLAAGVPDKIILTSGHERKWGRILPFQFITAARHAPSLEPYLEKWMFKACLDRPKLKGKNTILVDVSASMDDPLSSKSVLTRLDAACSVAMLLREICEDVRVFTFSTSVVEVPARRGFALRNVIDKSQHHGGTHLGMAVQTIPHQDRIIVITDEQTRDKPRAPDKLGYMVNVAVNRNGVGYGPWLHVDGWSEAIIDYIMAYEEVEYGKEI